MFPADYKSRFAKPYEMINGSRKSRTSISGRAFLTSPTKHDKSFLCENSLKNLSLPHKNHIHVERRRVKIVGSVTWIMTKPFTFAQRRHKKHNQISLGKGFVVLIWWQTVGLSSDDLESGMEGRPDGMQTKMMTTSLIIISILLVSSCSFFPSKHMQIDKLIEFNNPSIIHHHLSSVDRSGIGTNVIVIQPEIWRWAGSKRRSEWLCYKEMPSWGFIGFHTKRKFKINLGKLTYIRLYSPLNFFQNKLLK